ncbi:hypothetical protein Peur_068078 [Populus x canadensis]
MTLHVGIETVQFNEFTDLAYSTLHLILSATASGSSLRISSALQPIKVGPPQKGALPRYEQNRISLDHYSRWNQPKREKKSFGLPELPSHRSPFLFVRALHGHHYVKEEIASSYFRRTAGSLGVWVDAPVSDICLIIQ